MNYPQQFLAYFLDTLFPVRCINCGSFSTKNKEYVCKKCVADIPLNKKFECIGCRTGSPLGKTCFECPEFASIDSLLIVSDYKNPILRKALKTLKYRFIPEICDPLGELIKKYIGFIYKRGFALESPLLVPIPLHGRRLNWRGFNQAELLSQKVAAILLCDIRTDVLTKKNESRPQAEITDKEERVSNVAGIFEINNQSSIRGRNIIIIDDVCTSGSTLNEAARVLKKNGAAKIVCLAIARG